MDFHLSVFLFISGEADRGIAGAGRAKGRDFDVDMAWVTAVEDFEADIAGHATVDFGAFRDSVFELADEYVARTEVGAYQQFLSS
eukprot:5631906-Prymnesium_polylepis.1